MDEKIIDEILAEVKKELLSANEKFPLFNSAHEGYAVLKEEVDELWDDVKNNYLSHSMLEAVQVSAMAVKYIASIRIKTKI